MERQAYRLHLRRPKSGARTVDGTLGGECTSYGMHHASRKAVGDKNEGADDN